MKTNGYPPHVKNISQKHLMHWPKQFTCFCAPLSIPSDIFSPLLQNLTLKCLHFFPLPDYSLMISGSRYNWCAVSVHGIPLCSWVSAGRTKWEFATTWKLELTTKNFWKNCSAAYSLNYCNDSFVFWYWHSHCARTGFTVVVSCNFELADHSCPLHCLQREVAKLGCG